MEENADLIDSIVDYNRDYILNYFGLVSLVKSYVIRVDNEVVERP